MPSDARLATIRDLGTAFVKATYPIADFTNFTSPIPIVTPGAAAVDWLATIAAGLGVPVDALLPFVFLFELNDVAGLLPSVDRLMGVLPNNWFDRFIYDIWEGVNGLSLTEYSPHAVIFLSSHNGNPAMTLPGHELGHTFGLSTDPTLKSWACDVDIAVFSSLLCGALGGFDEYKHEDAAFKPGNPSQGFWVRRGDEPASLLMPGMVDAPQCDSHCLMGTAIENSHTSWASLRRWIDVADYDHLIDKLSTSPDPDLIFVSGMISRDDRIFLGSWYHLGEGVPDRDDNRGLYVFRFLDHGGATIQEVGLPLNRSATDVNTQDLPITFFGLRLPFPEQTKSIEIWNRVTGKLLAAREVSLNVPKVQIVSPWRNRIVVRGAPLPVRWGGQDADGDKLTYALQVSPDGKQWWPVAHQLAAERYRMQTDALPRGQYFLKVLAHDGIHVGESQIVRFMVRSRLAPYFD